jgi:nucleotide-binding universal stress UspA family protein
MDRIVEGETTLQVMRLSPVPVLAVSTGCDNFHGVVVATDFSAASDRAAKVALELLGKSGTLYAVHVEPPVELLPGGFALVGDARYPGDVVVWFRRFIESLKPPPGIIVETTVLNGKPVPAILEFADRVGASMIAAGSHSFTRVERFLLGSVSTGLVRNAKCPVLVAPAGE